MKKEEDKALVKEFVGEVKGLSLKVKDVVVEETEKTIDIYITFNGFPAETSELELAIFALGTQFSPATNLHIRWTRKKTE